jgi:hypothetical protein
MLPRGRRPDDLVYEADSDRVIVLVSRTDVMTPLEIVKGEGEPSGAEPD